MSNLIVERARRRRAEREVEHVEPALAHLRVRGHVLLCVGETVRVLVTRDPHDTARWRASRFENGEPTGHVVYATPEAAVREEVLYGAVRFDAAEVVR